MLIFLFPDAASKSWRAGYIGGGGVYRFWNTSLYIISRLSKAWRHSLSKSNGRQFSGGEA